jgi:hypothetical protein
MFDEPPPPEPAPLAAEAPQPLIEEGKVVIDLTQFAPKPPADDCAPDDPDPLNSEIVVCATTGPSPRLGPVVGPVDEEFGSAIPRARIKLSETAEAEANLHNAPVGGFNANGGEVRLKIDF